MGKLIDSIKKEKKERAEREKKQKETSLTPQLPSYSNVLAKNNDKYGLSAAREEKSFDVQSTRKLGLIEQIKREKTAGSIIDRLNSWHRNNNNFVSNHQTRFSGLTGTYNDPYMPDTEAWLSTVTEQKNRFDTEADSIVSFLSANRDLFDEEWLNSTVTNLDFLRKQQDSIIQSASDINKYWSQWENVDDYNKWATYAKDREEKLSYDLDKGAHEIALLEQQLSEMPITQQLISPLRGEINEKKAYYNLAEEFQTYENLKNEAINDPNFKSYAARGAGAPENVNMHTGVKPDRYAGRYQGAVQFATNEDWLAHMTEEQREIYNYHIFADRQNGTQNAEKFLELVEKDAQSAMYGKAYEKFDDSVLGTVFYNAAANVVSAATGIEAFISKDGSARHSGLSESISRAAENERLKDLDLKYYNIADREWKDADILGKSLGQVISEGIGTTAHMVPSILASSLASIVAGPEVGKVVGAGTLGISAAGAAKQQLLDLGYERSQANLYGILVGASEGALEYLLGGISNLGGKAWDTLGKSKVANVVLTKVDDVLRRIGINADSALLTVIGNTAKSMGSEALEEGLQTIIEPWFESVVLGTDYEAPEYEEVLYSSLLGALTAFGLEGAANVASAAKTSNIGKSIQNIERGTDKLLEVGKTYSADSAANRLASKIETMQNDGKSVGAHTIGKLFIEEGATLSEQNRADIKNALIAQNIDKKSAKVLTDVFADFIDGGIELTDKESQILESFSPLAAAVGNEVIGKDSSVYRRNQKYSELSDIVSRSSYLSDTNDGGKVAQEPTVASEGLTEAREEKGATYETSDAKVKEISSVKDGKITVKLESGEVVDASEVDFGNEDVALVYRAAAEMSQGAGYNEDTVKVLVNGFESSGLNASEYLHAFRDSFNYGATGTVAISALENGKYTSLLSEKQRELAFHLGKAFGEESAQRAEQERARIEKEKTASAEKEAKAVETSGGVIFDGSVNQGNLSKAQNAQIKVLQSVSSALGAKIRLFASEATVTEDGRRTRVFSSADGEAITANGWYDNETGEIWIDVNAGVDGNGLILFTAAHELTHFIKDWSSEKYDAFANFLISQYAEKGVSVDELIEAQIEKAAKRGREMTREEAFDEVVADSCESFLADSNAAEKIAALNEKDATLAEKIKSYIHKLLVKIRNLLKGIDPDSEEGKIVRGMTDSLEQLYELWTDALADAGRNYGQADMGSEKGLVQYSERIEDYDKPISFQDIERLRSIGRKSINKFTSEDIEKAQKWAYKFYQELGVKSPFFRAWFGDWRAKDKGQIKIVSVPTIDISQASLANGNYVIKDTEWNVYAGKTLNDDTRHHSGGNRINVKSLNAIEAILDNAVLLDTIVSEKDTKKKSENTAFLHKLYTIIQYNDRQYIAKTTVEEYYNETIDDVSRRAYNLKAIKIEPVGGQIGDNSSSSIPDTSSIISISDLYKFVNSFDKDFSPAREVSEHVLNKNGTPKVFYHGTNESFTAFSYREIGNATGVGILGDGFYFTDKKPLAKAYGKNVMPCYLKMEKPYIASASEAYTLSTNKLLKQGYDGVILDAPKGSVYLVFENTQIKSATDNIGTFDSKNPDIRYSERDPDAISSREVLANALEGAVQNDIEAEKLAEYKSKIAKFDAEEQKLRQLRAEIKELSFTPGKRDNARLAELRAEAEKTANRINIYDKQLLRLEASKPLEGILQREKQKAYKRAKADAAEKMNDMRAVGVREKIKKIKAEIERELQRPTDRTYIPTPLGRAMIEVCSLIDTDTPLIKKDGTVNRAQEKREKTKERLSELAAEYENLKNNDDYMLVKEHDEQIDAYLKQLRNEFDDVSIKDMSLDQLREFHDILRSIIGTLRDARKVIGKNDAKSLYEYGNAIISEQKKIGEKRGERSNFQKQRDKRLNLSLSPMRNIERMSGYNPDSALVEITRDFEEGVRKKNFWEMGARKSFDSLITGKNEKNYQDSIYKEFGKEYTDSKGRKFRVSKMQMMQAILSYEREISNAGKKHIEKGGLTFADLKLLEQGKIADAVSGENAHNVPNAAYLVADFISALTNDKWAQDYMAAAREFFNKTAKDAINDTYLRLKHRIIARDKNYIPYEVDKTQVVRDITNMDSLQQTINSYGILQDTQKNAPQALIITGLNNMVDRHIDQVGSVYGLAIPVRNFNKIWNIRESAVDGGQGKPITVVQGVIEENWGADGKKFIEQMVTDLQGARKNTRSELERKIESGYIGATFALNLSVVMKQIGSLYTANSELDRSRTGVGMLANLAYTMAHFDKLAAEVDKYTAAVYNRRQGLSDNEVHTFITQAKKSGISRALNKLPAGINPTKWITFMDASVALSLWKYVKADVAKNTNLKGEELLKETAKRFDSLIENTQSMSDVLHKPEIQKRQDVFSKSFAMFKTDLYQSAGQLRVMAGRYQANKSDANKKALTRTVVSIARSAAWNSLMTTLFALLRYKVNPYRDDEEELTLESWLKRQGVMLAGDFAGYLFPIFGSEIVGLIENVIYGESEEAVDSLALTLVNDLVDSITTIGNAITEGEMPDASEWENLLMKSAQFLGIPLSNIKRTVKAIRFHAEDIANGEFLSFEAGANKTDAKQLYDAVISGNDKRIEKAEALFDDQKAIDSALRKGLRENDVRIKAAARMLNSGDIRGFADFIDTISGEGFFDGETVEAAIRAEASAFNSKIKDAAEAKRDGKTDDYIKIVKELRERYRGVYMQDEIVEAVNSYTFEDVVEDDVEEVESVYKNSDINAALESGDTETASEIIKELIEVKTENNFLKAQREAEESGKRFKEKEARTRAELDARSAIRSSLTSYWKKRYITAFESGNRVEVNRIRTLLHITGIYGKRLKELDDILETWLEE